MADGGFESYSRHRTSRSRQQSRTYNEGRRKKDPTAEEAKGDSGTSSQVQILLSSLLIKHKFWRFSHMETSQSVVSLK